MVGKTSEGTVSNRPVILEIVEVVEESPKVKTFKVRYPGLMKRPEPGQFFMVWVIGVDEIPISAANMEDGLLWLSVAKVGEATEKLHKLRVGDKIGVRGPYGNSFNLNFRKFLMVGGGYGVAPLLFAARKVKENGGESTVVIGARTKEDVIFEKEISKVSNVIVTTNDGSYGLKGNSTDVLEELISKGNYDQCLTCGPEAMMRKVYEICREHSLGLQALLERYMKCGIGICGSCMLGKYRVCKDGPVFDTDMLRDVEDVFGFFRRDATGRKSSI
ncbi:MAG: dihydroorotate dehydrogenase electron transfer subunit [Candidatus Asgardarchaeia archaeon]